MAKRALVATGILVVIAASLPAQDVAPQGRGEGRAQDAPQQGDNWTRTLMDRSQRGKLHDGAQFVRGDSGRWQDEPLLVHTPPLARKPPRMSLDDWADQSHENPAMLTGGDENWLVFRTRQLDDNDRVWVERVERRGNKFTLVVNEAIWQGRYQKTFTYYDVVAINLGKLEPGEYEAKCVIQPLEFKQLEGNPQQPRESWPKDERPAEKKPVELKAAWSVSKGEKR